MTYSILELNRLIKAATPLPWGWESFGEKGNHFIIAGFHPPATGYVREYYNEETDSFAPPEDYPVRVDNVVYAEDAPSFADAELICAAVNTLPELLDRVKVLEQENADLRTELERRPL